MYYNVHEHKGTSRDFDWDFNSIYDMIHFKSAVLAEISGGARCNSSRRNLFADLRYLGWRQEGMEWSNENKHVITSQSTTEMKRILHCYLIFVKHVFTSKSTTEKKGILLVVWDLCGKNKEGIACCLNLFLVFVTEIKKRSMFGNGIVMIKLPSVFILGDRKSVV